jgi:P27 family predicted phage terminase small subunit
VLIRHPSGRPIRNPALDVQEKMAHLIRQFASEFGLSPGARARLENRGYDSEADNIFSGTG